MNNRRRSDGFTLLEILIALFIFTILSLLMTSGLRTVIDAQSGTERKAEQISKLQMVLLIMSRDIEQTINRPVIATTGQQDPAFKGTQRGFTFTHTGFANQDGTIAHSSFQRSSYYISDGSLYRETWPVLDQAPQSKPHARRLLSNLDDAHFEYLDKEGRFHSNWPADGQANQPLPRAVRVYLTISQWGQLSQLYVISAQQSKASQPPNRPATEVPQQQMQTQ